MIPEKVLIKRVLSYVDDHYKRWIDFAFYHCTKANKRIDLYRLMSDIQNEILSLRSNTIVRLMSSQIGNYTRLDFLVLRSIKRRIHGIK